MLFSSWKQKLDRFFKQVHPDVLDLSQIEQMLHEADISRSIVSEILLDIKKEGLSKSSAEVREILKKKLLSLAEETKSKELSLAPPQCLLLVGINGVGKTTTAARLANLLSTKHIPVLLGAADTFRAGASEQLKEWGAMLNIEVVSGPYGADPAAIAFQTWQKAKSLQAVAIIDTAGRMHTKSPLMDQLKKIERVLEKDSGPGVHRKLLVLDGNLGQNSILQAREFHSAVSLDGIILTKMDGNAKGGFVLQAVKELKLPVFYIGVGEKAQDLIEFNLEAFVSQLL